MSMDRWQQVDELFQRLVDMPAEDQSSALDEACADDPELRVEVEGLLRADRAASGRVADVVARAFGDVDAVVTGGPGDAFGPYTLVREIGRGGMGTVFLAERTDASYEGRVAIKVLRRMHTREARERFLEERRILAALSHPGIARLIDGGETERGQPYLVMEYVDGEPIDDYADREGLDTRTRVRLFREVCDAVQYAHGRLVVHRDLKPANVLVDADGAPRLLDFGIAKLLDPGSADRTRTGMRPMTPGYASPEQIRCGPITTATDVYALGLVLYELLTGVLPHETEGRSVREVENAILTVDPPAPSSVAPRTDARGDLDTIVLKALSKEPERRYDSVEQLGEDLGRYLEGLPVRARPDTWTYRAQKFVRRNRGAVLTGVTTVLSLLAFGVSSSVQAYQLQQQRDEARTARDESRAVTGFIVDVFEATDPSQAQGLDVTARDILARAGARVRGEFDDQPEVQGAVMTAIGRAYQRLGVHDSATVLFQASVDRAVGEWGDGSVEHASALRWLGAAHRGRGDARAAREVYQRVLDLRLDLLGREALETGDAWNNLGGVLNDLGEFEAAEEAHREALRIRLAHLDESDEQVLTSLSNLGSVYIDLGRDEEAIDFTLRALEGERIKHVDAPHLDVAVAANNHGSALQYGGRLSEAEPFFIESLEIREQLLAPDHPSVLIAKNNLGLYYRETDRPEAAARMLGSILPARRARNEPVPLAVVLTNYARSLLILERAEEAAAAAEEAVVAWHDGLGPDHPNVAHSLTDLGRAYSLLGRAADAERVFVEAIELRSSALGEDHHLYLYSSFQYGAHLLGAGRLTEAEPWLARARAGWHEALDPDASDRLRSDLAWARLLAAHGDTASALELARETGDVADRSGSREAIAAEAGELIDALTGVER